MALIKPMKALLLLSSGIDSPVAGRMMIEQDVEVFALNLSLLEDDGLETQKVVALAKKIGVKKLFLADLKPSHKAYRDNCNPRFTCIFCKRMMLRIAEKLAQQQKCDFIITGENLGQVASQTLDNIAVIQSAINTDVLSPLLGYDKNETVKIAKKYDTYELSIKKSPACPFLPNKPATTSKAEKLESEESRINIKELISDCLSSVKQIY